MEKEREKEREKIGRSPGTAAFVSPPQGRVARKGVDVVGWKTKRENFNVCLPREAIKINTSNYQAVLNFLGATNALRRLYPLLPPASPHLTTHPPPILRKFFLHRTTGRISLHSRAFTFSRSCNYAVGYGSVCRC